MIYGQILNIDLGLISINSHKDLNKISSILNKNYPNKKFHIISGIWWSLESVTEIFKLLFIIITNKVKYNNINLYIMCNTYRELKIIKFFGISGIYCNQNCFIDERIFNISNQIIIYNVVYNGVLRKFKRHYLLKKIDKIAIITYNFKNINYRNKLISILPKSTSWLNYSNNNTTKFLNEFEISEIYCKSKVGVALSKKEGSMYAVGEYLLCGLPIISTKSKGGRDIFLNERNSIISKANPISLNKAFNDLTSKEYNPEFIREQFLEIIKIHRNEFLLLIKKIYEQNNYSSELKSDFTSNYWFVNKLRNDLTEEFILSKFK
jgi:glycosyltransferase involved in cell wall biosynthesis